MSHARVEEVSDSDPEEMDPSDFEPHEVMRPADIPSSAAGQRAAAAAAAASGPGAGLGPGGQMPPGMRMQRPDPAEQARQREKFKKWQSLYPIYFDSTRSRKDGRRVGNEHSVENPLARDIAEAVSSLGYQVALDPGKVHPKDWANPGRVKVNFKSEEGEIQDPNTNNKHHLYIKIAAWLKAHPTTKESPLKMPIAGIPNGKAPDPPHVPRGRKMGSILPMHSPALTGGGVSENMLKDMMAEMQGMPGMPAGMPGLPGASAGPSALAAAQQDQSGASQSKKEKKKNKR